MPPKIHIDGVWLAMNVQPRHVDAKHHILEEVFAMARFVLTTLLAISFIGITGQLAVAADLPEPPTSWTYPPEMPGASVEVYRTVGDIELKAYIFAPKRASVSDVRPAIVFFFGGGWKAGTPGQFLPQSRYLADRGLVAISFDYRVGSRHNAIPQQCLADAKAAIRWTRANAKRLGIDPNRIVASGGSAGGHLAAATGLVKGFEDGEHTDMSSVPNVMALFNPAVILAPVEGHADLLTEEKLASIRERTNGQPETISPFHYVRSGLPPSIIFHGTNDDAVPFATVELFQQAMEAAGNRCELKPHLDKPHGFFNPGRGKGDKKAIANESYHLTMKQLDQFLVSLDYLEAK